MNLKKYEYFRTDLGVLYHGDCLKIMPELEPVVGKTEILCLTDPPYGIGVYKDGTMGGGVLTKQSSYSPVTWDNTRPNKNIFNQINRISKNAIIFGGNYFADILPPSPCWLVWDKDNGNNNFADCELAWTSFSSAVRKFKWKWQGMLKEAPEQRYHPTQKPVGLFMLILRKYAIPQDIILDPFIGSGTTTIACEKLNRRWIGIEISEEYCAIAKQRIINETRQLKFKGF